MTIHACLRVCLCVCVCECASTHNRRGNEAEEGRDCVEGGESHVSGSIIMDLQTRSSAKSC